MKGNFAESLQQCLEVLLGYTLPRGTYMIERTNKEYVNNLVNETRHDREIEMMYKSEGTTYHKKN